MVVTIKKEICMKKIFYSSFILLAGILIFSSCGNDTLDDSIPLNPVLKPFISVKAEDGANLVNATISDKDRTIVLELLNLKNLKEVKVYFDISKRAKLVTEVDSIETLDLTEPYEITLDNLFDEVTYTVTASIPEYILIDKSNFQEHNLENDTKYNSSHPMSTLWDNIYLKTVGDYASVGYVNYVARPSFTFDIGTRWDGAYYDLKQLRVNHYRAYEWTCPMVYELWGYMSPGVPPASGDWSDWTKLVTIDNSSSTVADFPEGDNVHFEKEESPSVRYLRIICKKNWKPSTDGYISLGEITLWSWNK